MNPFDMQAPIPGIKNVIVVGSGKGGVGKSTVSVNLAKSLAKLNRRVGLLDADIYGPSIPRMLGALEQRPEINAKQKMIPISRQGLKLMSIGFLTPEDAAVVWRGPMLFKAMDQFFRDVDWGDLDDLVIDLPPGTGDVGLTIAQKVPVTGAVMVCTPQNIALTDAKKALDMFFRINIPVIGVVENMSYMKVPSKTPGGQDEKLALFPKGELNAYLDAKGLQKLAEIPFNPHVALSCESGIPLVDSYPDSEEGKCFASLAQQVVQFIEKKASKEN